MVSDFALPSYRREPGVHPPLLSPDYRSTLTRAPLLPPIVLPHMLTEVTGPLLGNGPLAPYDNDLTMQHTGEAIGQRILVHGKVLDADGRPIPDALVEIWQANAAGRYRHHNDNWPAPVDPNFTGGGRAVTQADGSYTFTTIKPGAYPWKNNPNAWRPAHIHFSLFGRAFVQRLVTQMYFPDDPLFFQDPIFNSVRDEKARRRMVSTYDHESTKEEWALAFRFDIVLRGRDATPFEASP